MPLTEQQVIKFFEVLASSKLPSELTEKTTPLGSTDFFTVQSGTQDAQKAKPALARGINGDYNANTNTPAIINGSGVDGDSYRVSVAGIRDFGDGNVKLAVNDIIEYRSGKWIKLNQISNQNVLDALGIVPEDSANKGVAGGYVPLNTNLKIDAVYLPAFVEEIVEGTYIDSTTFNDTGGNPVTPASNKLYLDTTPSDVYRWSGSQFVKIQSSPGTTDDVAEGSLNKYFTSPRVFASVLSGLSTATNSEVVDGDSVIEAFGKLQAQINFLVSNGVDVTSQMIIDALSYTPADDRLANLAGDLSTAEQNAIKAKLNVTDGVLDQRQTASVSGATNLDVSQYTVFDLTLTGATDFTITNLPTGTDAKTFTIYLTGAFSWTLAQGTEEASSDPYNGAGRNRIQVDIINGTSGSEDITYQIQNL